MLEALGVADAARVIVCVAPSPRAHDPEVVAAAARHLGPPADRVEIVPDVAAAVGRALAVTPPDGQIVVTGSLYTVGAARATVGHRGPGEVGAGPG
jgi:dihydrofolate synthase/folylpolyglutamate synthase